jgi:RHS repeat-associated protein
MGSVIEGGRDLTGQLYMRNRFYDPQSGRFTQEDPIGIAGGLNVYGFGKGDPVSYSDPYGLWPTPVHHEMIATALYTYLNDRELGIVEAASDHVDGPLGQLNSQSYKHSMRAPGQSPQEAIKLRDAFVGRELMQARILEQAGHHDDALEAFGEAAHALMDSTSPYHVDANGNPKEWDVTSPTNVAQHVRGEGNTTPTAAQKAEAIRLVQQSYRAIFDKSNQ